MQSKNYVLIANAILVFAKSKEKIADVCIKHIDF